MFPGLMPPANESQPPLMQRQNDLTAQPEPPDEKTQLIYMLLQLVQQQQAQLQQIGQAMQQQQPQPQQGMPPAGPMM
jgi:hypothetical protein